MRLRECACCNIIQAENTIECCCFVSQANKTHITCELRCQCLFRYTLAVVLFGLFEICYWYTIRNWLKSTFYCNCIKVKQFDIHQQYYSGQMRWREFVVVVVIQFTHASFSLRKDIGARERENWMNKEDNLIHSKNQQWIDDVADLFPSFDIQRCTCSPLFRSLFIHITITRKKTQHAWGNDFLLVFFLKSHQQICFR